MNGIVRPEEFDYFHELIINFELARFGTRGFVDGLLNGAVIGLPPVLNYGSPELQAEIVPQVLSGKKYIALGEHQDALNVVTCNMHPRGAIFHGNRSLMNFRFLFV